MRIAHPVPRGEQPWSGVLTAIVHLSAALAKRGHEVEVWQLHEWTHEYAEPCTHLDAAGVKRIPVAQEVASVWQMGRAAAHQAEEGNVDVVHLHGAFNTSNSAISSALRRPYVFSPHSGYDPISLRRSRGRKIVFGRLFERKMLGRAAIVVALTEVELEQLRNYGADGPCAVIPNGVNSVSTVVDPLEFRRELGIGLDVLLAIFVGRLDVYRKGLDVLVDGIAEAPGWHLAMVGPDFRGCRHLRRTIRSLRISQRVHFPGVRYGPHLHEALTSADLFALLSRWEGLPMALLEALSIGKPAVVSPAVERVIGVDAAGAGWVTEGRRCGALLRRLEGPAREQLNQRGAAARLLARRYDWDVVAQQYESVYERARQRREPVKP